MQVKSENRKVTISVLNWNSAEETLKCVDSLLSQDSSDFDIELLVIDNGSADEDWEVLQKGTNVRTTSVLRQKKNLGFAGGHNLALRRALSNKSDFIWLVNSDAIVEFSTLQKLITHLDNSKRCGVVSPAIFGTHDSRHVDFMGAMHDWQKLDSKKPLRKGEALLLEKQRPNDMWVVGTAMLFRVAALREVGLLDESLFAYYEDDDICARLARLGWTSQLAENAQIFHSCYAGVVTSRPPYYFYLMQRNYFSFWLKHTPSAYRKFIRLRLLDRSFYEVNKLYYRGFEHIANAALLGLSDAVFRRSGPPNLDRPIPMVMKILQRIFGLQHIRALRRLDQ